MLRTEPAPTSTTAIVEPVLSVPPPVHVTVELLMTEMPLTAVVAPVIELLAVNEIVVPLVHAVVNGPVADVPHVDPVSDPLVWVLFQ